MNEVFNLRRFLRLFIKHTAEHYQTYFMAVAVLAGVMLLGGAFLFFMIQEPPDPVMQNVSFVFLLIIAGTIFTSTIFSDYGRKSKAIPALTLPATAFEKFLVGWLWSYPIYILVYLGVFYLVLYGLGSTRTYGPGRHFDIISVAQPQFIVVLLMFSVMQAVTMFGAVFFNALHFIKTGFTFFIGLGAMIALNLILLKLMTGLKEINTPVPFGNLAFSSGESRYTVDITEGNPMLVYGVMGGITILLWSAAYFRLKEKQV